MAVEISGKTGIVMPQGDTQVALFKYIPSGVALPTENIGPIWSDDYAATMVWTTVGTYTGYVSTNIGQVVYVDSATAPVGYVASSGQTLSGSPYQQLIAFRGSAVLIDLRGEFIRGWDGGRGKDAGRSFGSAQAQDWKSFSMTNTNQGTSEGYSHGPVDMGKSTTTHVGVLFTGAWNNPSAGIGTKWDNSEIRPTNVALLPCIKY